MLFVVGRRSSTGFPRKVLYVGKPAGSVRTRKYRERGHQTEGNPQGNKTRLTEPVDSNLSIRLYAY